MFKTPPKKLRLDMRIDGLFRIQLHQLALKNNMTASEYIRKLVKQEYANYGKK